MNAELAAPPALAPVPDGAAVVAALLDAIVLVDGDDTVGFVNPAAEEMFGMGAGLLTGRPLADLVQFDSPLIALSHKARAGLAGLSEYDIDLHLPQSGARRVDVQVAALHDVPGWVVLSLRERSIARKLDRQLSHLGAGRSVAGLAATLAHEIKNPLSGIRGAAQLIGENATPGDRELTGLIVDETDRICRLVDRMEVFSDTTNIDRGPVNIHEVLEHVRRVAQSGFARALRFVERYDPSLPPVLGDRDQLVQVFLNLVKNAAEAAPARGGEIVVTTAFEPGLRLSLGGAPDQLRLPLVVSIQDNGNGVPDELRAHVFEPFVSGKSGGTGLGLPLVAKIVGDHGGVIEFDSTARRTIFRVLLPLHAGGEAG